MGRTISTSLKLDGEKEFKQAIGEINSGLKVLSSEMQLSESAFRDNASSVAALTEKSDILERKLLSQKDKVDTLREALQKSAQKNGEADKKTQEWQASLNKAQAALNDTERELKENNKALDTATQKMQKYGLAEDEATKNAGTLGGVLNNLTDTLGISLPAGLTSTMEGMDAGTVSAGAFLGVAASLAKTMAEATFETAALADEIVTMSKTTGMSTDAIQELNYASELLDVSTETVSSSMTKMIRSMDDAKRGTGDAGEAFQTLHVKVTGAGGQLRDANDVFYDAVDALGKVKNETERDALAMQIFGRSARDLNPLIEAGSKELRGLADAAHETGYVMSGETLDSYNKLQDAMDSFDNTMQTFKQSLGTVLLPILTVVIDLLSKVPPDVLKIVVVLATLAAAVIGIVKAIKGVSDAAKTITSVFGGSINPTMLKTIAIVMAVVAALIALGLIIVTLTGKAKEFNNSMSAAGKSVSSIGSGGNIRGYASGTDYHPGGLAIVGEEGPELALLPRGTQVIPHRQTMGMLRKTPAYASGTARTGGDIYYNYITIDAKNVQEFNDIVRIAKRERMTARQGRAK